RSQGNPVSERRCARGNLQLCREHGDAAGGVARGKVSVFPAVARQNPRRSGSIRKEEEGDKLGGFRRPAAKDVGDVSAARGDRGKRSAVSETSACNTRVKNAQTGVSRAQ